LCARFTKHEKAKILYLMAIWSLWGLNVSKTGIGYGKRLKAVKSLRTVLQSAYRQSRRFIGKIWTV